MRVLHLIPSMAGGGAERALSQLAGPLAAAGCDVHVGLLRGGLHEERLAAPGVTVHRIGVLGNYDPRIVLSIDRLVRRLRPDIVQTWLTQMDIAGGIVARLRRVPWILTERSSALNYRLGAKNALRIALASGAAIVQANSEGGRSYWAGKCPRVPGEVVPNPIALAPIARAEPADVQRFGGKPLILFGGRLTPIKNIARLLDAMTRVPDAVLVMLGEGELEHDVRRWIAERHLDDRVVLEGFVPNVWSWMKAAKLLVAVSRAEGQPNVVLEAAACRLPLVLSDIPAHRELLGDCDGARFVDPHDAGAIAAGILDTLADRDAAEMRARRAYDAVAEWTPEAIAARQLRLYEDLLK